MKVGSDLMTCCGVRSLMPASGMADRDDLDTALEAVARRPPCDRGVCITEDLYRAPRSESATVLGGL